MRIKATLSGSSLSYKLQTDTQRSFVIFSVQDAYTPIFLSDASVGNQNLHAVSTTTDMLINYSTRFYNNSSANS